MEKQNRIWIKRISAVLCLIACVGCAGKKTSTSAVWKDRQEILKKIDSKSKYLKGKAWLSVKAPEGSAAFPARVAIQRGDVTKFRLEAIDLLGASHVLLLSTDSKTLNWIDFDQHRWLELKGSWQGIPLRALADLLVGFEPSYFTKEGRAVEKNGLSCFEKDEVTICFSYLRQGQLQETVLLEAVGESKHMRFKLTYSGYSSSFEEGLLPREIKLETVAKKSGSVLVSLELKWRERTWLEAGLSDDAVFQLPSPIDSKWKN